MSEEVKSDCDNILSSYACNDEIILSEVLLIKSETLDTVHDKLKCLNQAIEKCSFNISALSVRMKLLQESNHLQQAITDCKSILELNSSIDSIRYNLGSMLLELKQYNEACAILQQGITLNRFFMPYYKAIARSLIALGQYNDAVQILENAANQSWTKPVSTDGSPSGSPSRSTSQRETLHNYLALIKLENNTQEPSYTSTTLTMVTRFCRDTQNYMVTNANPLHELYSKSHNLSYHLDKNSATFQSLSFTTNPSDWSHFTNTMCLFACADTIKLFDVVQLASKFKSILHLQQQQNDQALTSILQSNGYIAALIIKDFCDCTSIVEEVSDTLSSFSTLLGNVQSISTGTGASASETVLPLIQSQHFANGLDKIMFNARKNRLSSQATMERIISFIESSVAAQHK